MIEQVKAMRQHAKNRTVIVPSMELQDLPLGTLYSDGFWQDQLNRDPERSLHISYKLFWVWLSKSWFTTQAIRLNPFHSDLFLWSDIGCFREGKYNHQTIIRHREIVPANEMLFLAHTKPNPRPGQKMVYRYEDPKSFYHSGSLFVGYKETWTRYHEKFLETMDRSIRGSKKDHFGGSSHSSEHVPVLPGHLCLFDP